MMVVKRLRRRLESIPGRLCDERLNIRKKDSEEMRYDEIYGK